MIRGFDLVLPARESAVPPLRRRVTALMRKAEFSSTAVDDVELALDEALNNVIEHTYKYDARQRITFQLRLQKSNLRMVIKDHGPAFDSAGLGKVDMEAYFKQKRQGGLGVALMLRLLDRVEFRHGKRRGNTLILEKKC